MHLNNITSILYITPYFLRTSLFSLFIYIIGLTIHFLSFAKFQTYLDLANSLNNFKVILLHLNYAGRKGVRKSEKNYL